MPLPYPENTVAREADTPQRSLVKINQLISDLIAYIAALSGVTIGTTDSPEGATTGNKVGDIYVQLNGDGGVAMTWYFNGTPGENTGWITNP